MNEDHETRTGLEPINSDNRSAVLPIKLSDLLLRLNKRRHVDSIIIILYVPSDNDNLVLFYLEGEGGEYHGKESHD